MCAVEWKKLGDVCYFQNGFAFKSNKFKDEGLGIVRITNIKDSILDLSSLIYFEKSDYPNQILKQYEIHKGDILIAMSGATTGKIGCSLSDETLYLNQRVGKFIPCEELDNRYLYHLLKKDEEFFYQLAGGGAQPNLSSIKLMDSYCFYLPSLAKQQEIVSHLDTFTTLISNLESELDMRRKQYEHYRNQLLDFEGVEGVEWKTIEDIAEIGTGSSNTKDELDNGLYPFFVRSQQVRWQNKYEYDETAIITSGDGVGVGKIFHYIEGKYALHQRAYRIHILDTSVVAKYVYNYMKCKFYDYIMMNAYSSSVTSVRRPMLLNFEVPIPSSKTQQEIVEKLDAFENLIQSLEQEIKLRKQQYEYYREKLLTFEKE